MVLICEYCNHELSTYTNLKVHYSTKKCQAVQQSLKDKEYNILIKNNVLTTNLQEIEKKLQDAEIKIQRLEAENLILRETSKEKNIFIEKAISKPTQTSNSITQNNTLNVTPMYTQEQYAEIAREKFTIQHFNKGARGISNFIGETIPQEMLSFSDMSRNVLSYKDATGKNIKDTNGLNFLTKLVRPSIIDPATSIYNKIQEDIANEPPSPVNSDSESDNELEERKTKKQLKLEKAEKNMNDISKLGKRKVARTTIVDGLKVAFNKKASFNAIDS